MKHFDAVVIGAGQAGIPLAKKLAESGKKTAIIERRLIGGTCVNDGCTPTKAMIASAKAAHMARTSPALGVHQTAVTVNFEEIVARKNKLVKDSRSGNEKQLKETKNLEIIMGEASFISADQLSVKLASGKRTEIRAGQVFIDAGGQAIVPEISGIHHSHYLTSTSILDLKELPDHLIILGGNYIGLEFAQMFSRFGSKVTIIEQSGRIAAKEDPDISNAIEEFLLKEGIDILTDSEATKIITHSGDSLTVEIKMKSGFKQVRGSHLLVAIGRKPNTSTLVPANAGIKLDKHGFIKVNAKLQTNIKHIYALGDVKGGPAFTHIAYNDYTIVYRNLYEKTNYSINRRPVPYCMFTDPQLGRIGLSETQAREKGLDFEVAVLPMSSVARGVETNQTAGLMKAVVDKKTKKILGVAILGDQGGEIMSVLQMAMEGNVTYDRLRYCVFAHPTYSESINNLFMKLDA